MTSPRTVEALAFMAKIEHIIPKFRAVIDTGSSILQICGVRCTQHSISIFSLQKNAGCRRFQNPLGALMPLVLTSDIAVEEYAPSQMELRERGLILIGPHRRRPRVRDGRYRSHSAQSHYAASKIRALRVMARVTSMPTIPLVK